MIKLTQFFCGLRGHVDVPIFESDRMALKCVECFRETDGWNLSKDGRIVDGQTSSRVEGPKSPLTAIMISRREARDLYQELQDIEMGLGCGG